MKEVAHLEAQFEAIEIKPKSKSTQRPKDTVLKNNANSFASKTAQKLKSVEPKQLNEVTLLLKLLLQQKNIRHDDSQSIAAQLLKIKELDNDISIIDL